MGILVAIFGENVVKANFVEFNNDFTGLGVEGGNGSSGRIQ